MARFLIPVYKCQNHELSPHSQSHRQRFHRLSYTGCWILIYSSYWPNGSLNSACPALNSWSAFKHWSLLSILSYVEVIKCMVFRLRNDTWIKGEVPERVTPSTLKWGQTLGILREQSHDYFVLSPLRLLHTFQPPFIQHLVSGAVLHLHTLSLKPPDSSVRQALLVPTFYRLGGWGTGVAWLARCHAARGAPFLHPSPVASLSLFLSSATNHQHCGRALGSHPAQPGRAHLREDEKRQRASRPAARESLSPRGGFPPPPLKGANPLLWKRVLTVDQKGWKVTHISKGQMRWYFIHIFNIFFLLMEMVYLLKNTFISFIFSFLFICE